MSSETSARPGSGKATISSRIADDLRRQILSGDLPPGSKINLDHLREVYRISASPLREAMSRLLAEGLVRFADQRGYAVTPISLDNLAEVTTLRAEFETLALGQAIEKGSLEWESVIMAALYRLDHTERHPGNAESLEAWEAEHRTFHVALISACEMPLLLGYCKQLHSLNDRYRRIFLAEHKGDRDVQDEHEAIAQAVVARDATLARSLLRSHIERTGINLRSRLEGRLNGKTATPEHD